MNHSKLLPAVARRLKQKNLTDKSVPMIPGYRLNHIMDALNDVIEECLSNGESVWIGRVGKIEPKYRPEYDKRDNLKGGVMRYVPARYEVRFVVSSDVQEYIDAQLHADLSTA